MSRTKVNDFYYYTASNEWLSWREVCEHRRYEDVAIVGKITKEAYTTIHVSAETRAKLDARRRAHDWTWDEYLDIICSLEEAFDET